MNKLHTLKVKGIKRETQDAVSVTFNIPVELKEEFSFEAGQYITLEKEIDNEKIRRAYSIWTAPFENEISVLIKQVENGKFSTYANQKLKEGDEMDVMAPIGNFKLTSSSDKRRVFFAAGSGITPIISMIKHELETGGDNKLDLFYINKSMNDTIFSEELNKLKGEYSNRLSVYNFFSREEVQDSLFKGRLNKAKCAELINKDVLNLKAEGYYLCGPEEMIFDVKDTLLAKGVNKTDVHFELFTTTEPAHEIETSFEQAKIFVTIDDDEFEYDYKISDADSLLDAGMDEGIDFPFSCKGGVCCTCKAKVMKGKAEMKINYALTDDEVEEGYILTCQSHPTTPELVISFDE